MKTVQPASVAKSSRGEPIDLSPSLPQNRQSAASVALDQWRGLALVFVLISHGFFFTGRVDGIGRVGVNIFFFISGILVFQSLSRMKSTDSWQRTTTFWGRRLRRLYPALLAYVITMTPVVFLLHRQLILPPYTEFALYLRAIPWVLGYLVNYHVIGTPLALGHLWSLACEMQFYLASPLLFWAGGKSRERKAVVFGLVLGVLFLTGILQPVLKSRYPMLDPWKYHFEVAVWPMMAGFYCEFRNEEIRRIPPSLQNAVLWLGIVSCLVSFLLMAAGFETKLLVIGAGAVLIGSCCVSYLNGRQITGTPGHALKWLGERTYSIYLWQQPLSICGYLPNYLHPLGALFSTVIGSFWFRLFEQPFISASRKKVIT